MSNNLKRTAFAQAAVDFGSYFAMLFTNVRVAGQVERRAQLVVPEGMSTGGGERSVQHITLQAQAPGYPVLTVGWVNLKEHRAQLRTFNCLASMHSQRFRGHPFDVDPGSYQQFFDQAQRLLASQGMGVQIEDRPPPVSRSTAPPPKKNTAAMVVIVLLALFVVVAGAIGIFYVYVYRAGHLDGVL